MTFKYESRKISSEEKDLLPLGVDSVQWGDDLSALRQHALETWLTLASNVQWAEALFKDAEFCVNTRK